MNKTVAIIAVVAVVVIGSMAAGIYFMAKLFYPAKTPVHAHEVCAIEDWGGQNSKDRVLFVGPHQDPLWITTNLPEADDNLEAMRQAEERNKNRTVSSTIHHCQNGKIKTILLKELPGPFPLAQPLEGNLYIVATASTFSPLDGFNAFIYDESGAVLRRLKLGPDINYIQVDDVGHIWVVYDNVKKHHDPYNAAGLVCFDQEGRVISQYPNKKVLAEERVRFPQALNVVSKDKLYLSPNKQMHMLCIKNGVAPTVLKRKLDIKSSAMAFGEKVCVLDANFPQELRICKADLATGNLTFLDVQKADGSSIEPDARDFSARGSRLYFTDKKNVYYLDAQDLPHINPVAGTSQAD